MGEPSRPSKWLVNVSVGTAAAVAAAYVLYLLPPGRILGRQDTQPAAEAQGSATSVGAGSIAPPQPSRPAAPESRERPVRATNEPRLKPLPAKSTSQAQPRPGLISSVLSPDTPAVLSSIDTVVSVAFRETLGSRYAEIVVDSPSQKSFRFPVRSAGGSREFEAHGQRYEIRVVAIDWQALRANITVRPAAGS